MKHYTVIAVALLAVLSCSRDTEVDPVGVDTGFQLQLRTEIDGMATKATVAGVDGLQENVVKTLDVYLYGTFKGDSGPSVKGFHLNADDDCDSGKWTVTKDWRKESLVSGNTYTIYVAANSTKVKTSDDSADSSVATQTLEAMGITTYDALRNAIEFDYDPKENNGAGGTKPFWGSNNDDGVNPAWLGVHKKYTVTDNITDVNAKADRYFTHEKSFLMNGTASFTPDKDDAGITVSPVTLSRAAAKITLNLSFDPGFLTKLEANKNLTVYGAPEWRFFNFAFNASVFGDLSQDASYNPKASRFTSSANIIGYSGITGNDLVYGSDAGKSFTFSTYSYPLSWTAATAGDEAPAIIVSVAYLDNTNPSLPVEDRLIYHAYKIPVVDPDQTIFSLERNNLYTIDAEISSEGSTLVTDAYEIKAAYSILPWGDDASASSIATRDNSYLDVIPDAIAETTDATDVILHGNGEQTFRLHVLKPDTKSYSIAYFGTTGATKNNPFGQSGTPTDYAFSGNYTDENGHTYTACAATGASVPYYFNLNGTVRNSIDSDPIQNCFVKDGDDIIIISNALPNKGVKYMKIRVFLDGHKTDAGKYMDVNIRHYPTDAILSIEGRWSSRQSACLVAPSPYTITNSQVIHGPEDYTITESAVERSVYDAHDGYKRWEWVVCNKTTYDGKPEDERSVETGVISRETYAAHTTGTNGGTVLGDAEPGYDHHYSTYGTGTDGNTGGDYGYYFYKNDGQTSYYYHTVLGTVSTIQSATTEATAFKSNHADEQSSYVYYWGEGTAVPSGEAEDLKDLDNYDYYTKTGAGTWLNPYVYHAFRYPTRKRVYYTGPIYKYKKYYITTTSVDPDAPRWVNWDNDLNTYNYTGSSPKIYYQGARYWNTDTPKQRYCAKIITDGASGGKGTVSYTRPSGGATGSVSVNSTSGAGEWCIYYGYQSGGSVPSSLLPTYDAAPKNRYMYVLQQSETSSEYTIGRPILDPETKMSKDDVVSPAFMTASQLAYESTGWAAPSPAYAAYHCASYLEVATNGTYYTGWRLPTRQEIATMIRYQGNDSNVATLIPGEPVSGDDRVMDAVLTATYYCALDGTWVVSPYRTGGDTTYSIRCVRDLSPEEIKALNN
jgi:hypothetical protein